MQDFTLPVQYLRQVAEQLTAMGADVSAWLARSRLSEAQLNDAGFQPDFGSFCQLIQDALDSTGEGAFGLLVGERLVVNTHGILGYAVLSSASFGQALQFALKYYRVLGLAFDLELLDAVAQRCAVPIIASGGAGKMDDFKELFLNHPRVDAGLAASIFHTKQVDIRDLKLYLRENGVEMRV